jgi:hypothetical protein
VKRKKGKGKGEMSWVDVLFPIKEKKGGGGREKGKGRES